MLEFQRSAAAVCCQWEVCSRWGPFHWAPLAAVYACKFFPWCLLAPYVPCVQLCLRCLQGFELQLGLWLEHLEQGKCQVTLGLALKTDDVKGPWQQGQQPPVSIAADLHVQLGGAVPRATYRNGAETVLLKHISTRLTATGQTWSYAVSRVSHVSQLSDYIRDRELRLRASLTKLDGQLLPRRV